MGAACAYGVRIYLRQTVGPGRSLSIWCKNQPYVGLLAQGVACLNYARSHIQGTAVPGKQPVYMVSEVISMG